MEANKIYVGKISRRIRESDLEKEFSKFGKIKEIELRTSYAFIEFENEKAAEESVEEMNGKYIDDSKVSVQLKGFLFPQIQVQIDQEEMTMAKALLPKTFAIIAGVEVIGKIYF